MKAIASNGVEIQTGDMVLVRESDTRTWFVSLFSYKIRDNHFICANGSVWTQCIPLESNEHLCGTNDEYEEPYTQMSKEEIAEAIVEQMATPSEDISAKVYTYHV